MSSADSFRALPDDWRPGPMDGATFPMPAAGRPYVPMADREIASEETKPFTPVWTEPLQALPPQPHQPRHAAPATEALSVPVPADTEPCRCGMCPEPDPDCKDALLSYAPGVTTRMANERVRNGQWVDIRAYAREAGLRVAKPAVDGLARIRTDVEHGRLDMDLLFDRTPDLHRHQSLAAGLRLAADALAAQLTAWQPGQAPATIAEMGLAVDVTAAITAERRAAA